MSTMKRKEEDSRIHSDMGGDMEIGGKKSPIPNKFSTDKLLFVKQQAKKEKCDEMNDKQFVVSPSWSPDNIIVDGEFEIPTITVFNPMMDIENFVVTNQLNGLNEVDTLEDASVGEEWEQEQEIEDEGQRCSSTYSSLDGEQFDAASTAAVGMARPFSCPVCGKDFTENYLLNRHMTIHSGVRPYVCKECGKAFRLPSDLTRHKITHTSVKPFKCNTCGKSFNRLFTLKTHSRIHLGKKLHKCEVCGREFHQSGNFNSHKWTHNQEKQHKCRLCGKAFHRSCYLTLHMNSHNDKKPFECSHCEKGYSRQSDLKRHIKKKHGTEITSTTVQSESVAFLEEAIIDLSDPLDAALLTWD